MIITKSPLRITLGGGGTDLASYYSEYEGFLISAAINKYVYITINDNFVRELWLKYSKIEHTTDINSIQHPIFTDKNLIEAHLGTGLTLFGSPACIVNEQTFNRNNALYLAFDFGITFKHLFSDRIFIAAVCDFSYIFPYSDRVLIVQPAFTAGINL